MKILRVEHLIIIYALIAKATSLSGRGFREMDALRAIIERQGRKNKKSPDYNHVFKDAAKIMKQIIEERPFTDGNKRVAMLSALTLVKINGHDFIARGGEIEDYANFVANEEPSVNDVATWLRKRSRLQP